jgi:hypothetical protein
MKRMCKNDVTELTGGVDEIALRKLGEPKPSLLINGVHSMDRRNTQVKPNLRLNERLNPSLRLEQPERYPG